MRIRYTLSQLQREGVFVRRVASSRVSAPKYPGYAIFS